MKITKCNYIIYFMILSILVSIKTLAQQTTTTQYEYDPISGQLVHQQIAESENSLVEKNITVDYAYLHYPAMEDSNMLSQVYEQDQQMDNSNYEKERSNWGYVNGAYRKASDQKYSNSDNTFITESTLSYDIYGNIVSNTDGNGNVISYKYGYDNAKLTAIIKNANQSEIGLADFEDGTVGSWWVYTTGGNIGNTAHTGQKGYHFDNTGNYCITARFSASGLNTSGKYIFSGWVKTSLPDPELQWYISYNNGSTSTYVANAIASGTGNWEYLQLPIDLSKYQNIVKVELYVRNSSNNGIAACDFDDLRFSPADAEMTTMTYDPVTLQLTSKSDPNSNSTYYEYDDFGRLNKEFATIDNKKKLIKEYRTQYSRNYSDNLYNTTFPNTKEIISYKNPSDFSDYSSSEGWTISGGPVTFGHQLNDMSTVMFSSSSSWHNIQRVADSKHVIARVDFYPTQTTGDPPYVLMFGDATYRFNIFYVQNQQKFEIQKYPSNTYVVFNLNAPINHWYTVEIEKFADGTIMGFVYPKGEGRIYKSHYYVVDNTSYPANWKPNVTSWAKNSNFYLANFYCGQPDRDVEFYDGLGQKLQEQQQDGDSTIVTSTLTYDNMGRVDKTYKPYEKKFSVSQLGLFDPSYTDNVQYYYNQGMGDYKYPTPTTVDSLYQRIEYQTDPLGRIAAEGFPGSTWSISSNHHLSYYYSANTSTNEYKTQFINEQGQETDTYSDLLGRKVKTIVDPGHLNYTTTFNYDMAGNLLSTTNPAGKISSYSYNTLKEVTTKSTAESGIVKYYYDKNGNLRLIKDANHTSNNQNNVNISAISTKSGSFNMVMPGPVSLSAAPNAGGTGMYCTITVKPQSGSAVIASITATTSTVAKSIYLPKGTYNYTITIYNGSFANQISCSSGYEFSYMKYDALNRIIEEGEYNSSSLDGDFTQANANTPSFPTSFTHVSKKYFYDVNRPDVLAAGQLNIQGRLSYSESYDINGNLASRISYSYDQMGRVVNMIEYIAGSNEKEILYSYDLQGNVTNTGYIDLNSNTDPMYAAYTYDMLGRMKTVSTSPVSSTTGLYREALYSYYANGKVQRLQLGYAQGVDYVYNTRDWLQMINHQNLTTTDDPGHDGGSNGIPVDKFGEAIGYDITVNLWDNERTTPQFGGNISWLMYNMYGVNFPGPQGTTSLVGNIYNYDRANRLGASTFGYYTGGWKNTEAYEANYNYDNIGNFISLDRWDGANGLGNDLGINNYYYGSTNHLDSLKIEDVGTFYYKYDGDGNVTSDSRKNISLIIYNLENLPEEVYTTGGDKYIYSYDADGNRIRKIAGSSDIHYINGVNGKTIVVSESPYGIEYTYNILGNDNIGQLDVISYEYQRFYYLKDHLGNIKVTVDQSGNKKSWNDYYPYGMLMGDGRSQNISNVDHRYMFTGKERDDETAYDYFGARYYDSFIGRWLQVDPLANKYPGWSPYDYVENNPIIRFDPNGKGDKDKNQSLIKKFTNAVESVRNWFSGNTKSIQNEKPSMITETSAIVSTSEVAQKVTNNLVSGIENTHTVLANASTLGAVGAYLTSDVPPISEGFTAAADITGNAAAATSLFKATITGRGDDWKRAGFEIGTAGVGVMGKNIVSKSNLVGEELHALYREVSNSINISSFMIGKTMGF